MHDYRQPEKMPDEGFNVADVRTDRGDLYSALLDAWEARSPTWRRSVLDRLGVRRFGSASVAELKQIQAALGMKPVCKDSAPGV